MTYAAALLRAMEEEDSRAGRKFQDDLENLYQRWERLVQALDVHSSHGGSPGPPSTLDAYPVWIGGFQWELPREYPQPNPLTDEQRFEYQRRSAVFHRISARVHNFLLPYSGDEANDVLWTTFAKEWWGWVSVPVRQANPNRRLRTSKRLTVRRYFRDVEEFCDRWRLRAWWAVPAILQSHSLRLKLGLQSLMGWYIVGFAWSPPEYTIVAQLPGTSEEDFESDRVRFSTGRLAQTIPDDLGDIEATWIPDRAEMRLVEESYGATCVVIRWDGHSHYPSQADPSTLVTLTGYIAEECATRLHRTLTKREKRALSNQVTPQIREGRAWFREQGWSFLSTADLETHARWLAQKLLDPSLKDDDLSMIEAAAGFDRHPDHIRHSCNRLAKAVALTLR
ncbi:MAG: hypothetical protein O3B84_03240 [Chloroflexi bacterium]|nr:hypothetical protein [Chloroflexota bacterium]